jgi:putative DNA primase/helicase
MDKRIVAALIGAERMLFLDNVNGIALKSDALASAITERPAYVRPLGSSTTVPLNSSALVTVTGNGLGWAEDLARRFIEVNLDAGVEDPESREFLGDFLGEARSLRHELLGAALTIWRWGRQQGDALPSGRPLGSFGDWARWCRDPMLAVGCMDPVVRMAAAKAEDPERAFLAELFDTWWAHHRDKVITAKKLHIEVKSALDPNGKSRQFQVAKLASLNGTRAAGYLLTRIPAIGRWSADSYRLTTTNGPDLGKSIEVIGGIDGAGRDAGIDVPVTRPPLSDEELDEELGQPPTL